MDNQYELERRRVDQLEEIFEESRKITLNFVTTTGFKIIYTVPIGVIDLGTCGCSSRIINPKSDLRKTLKVFFHYRKHKSEIIWNINKAVVSLI